MHEQYSRLRLAGLTAAACLRVHLREQSIRETCQAASSAVTASPWRERPLVTCGLNVRADCMKTEADENSRQGYAPYDIVGVT